MSPECLRLLESLGQPLSPELSAHLAVCQHCQAVAKAHETLFRAHSTLALPANATFEESLRRAASRPARPWWIDGLAIAAGNLVIVAASVLALRSSVAVGNLAPSETVWAIGFLLAAAIAAGPMIALAPGGRSLRKYVLASFPLIAVAVVVGGSGFQPMQSWMRAGMSCLVLEITLSVVPLIFAVWALTTSAFRVGRAVIAGMSAGAVGALALHLHCPFGSVSHLLFFHVLPWVGLAAATVAVRSRLASKTFAP